MSNATLTSTLPRDIDPRKFAQQRLELNGKVAVSDLPRLAEAVADQSVVVDVDLRFDVDEEGLRVVTGVVTGELSVICHRCLEPMPLLVKAEPNLAIVWDEDKAKNLPRRVDPWIVGEGATNIYLMIEEELLLELPMVSYHKEPCLDARLYHAGDEVEITPEEKTNPFQMLEQLKSSPKS